MQNICHLSVSDIWFMEKSSFRFESSIQLKVSGPCFHACVFTSHHPMVITLSWGWSGGSVASRLFATPPLGSLASLVLVTPPWVCRESKTVASLVTPLLVCGGSPSSGLLAGDNSSELGGRINLSFCSRLLLLIRVRAWWWLLITKGKGNGHIVECPNLGPSVQLAQGCLVVCDEQPWP